MTTAELAASDAYPKTSKSAKAGAPGADRLVSLDILRGFDMFFISGGEELFHALAKATGWAWAVWMATQMNHVEWAGFRIIDLVFPLFVFISGVTLPIVIEKRLSRGEGRGGILLKLLRRALILVLLGVIYNTGKISFDVHNLRFGSVLGRIGLAGFGAGVIVLFTSPRAQAGWALGILAFYWALLTFTPVPGQAPGQHFEKGKNVADWVDQRIMPGRLYNKTHDPEGLVSTLPAVATALLGALAGAWLRTQRTPLRKALGLLAAGLVMLALGRLWGLQFPIIKKLWTSTFVLYAAGWSCLLLALFYAVADGLRWRAWGFPFLLIGMNPLTIYLLRGTGLIDFEHIGRFFCGFAINRASQPMIPVYGELATIFFELALLYWLYRKKFFLRV